MSQGNNRQYAIQFQFLHDGGKISWPPALVAPAFDSVFEKEDAAQHQDYYISKYAQENELLYYDVRTQSLCIQKDLDNFESDPLDFSCVRVRKWLRQIREQTRRG